MIQCLDCFKSKLICIIGDYVWVCRNIPNNTSYKNTSIYTINCYKQLLYNIIIQLDTLHNIVKYIIIIIPLKNPTAEKASTLEGS